MRIPMLLLWALAVLWLGYAVSAAAAEPRPTRVRHAAWAENAVIYELNTRQFTPEGTFKAILPRIPELKALGVGIVWFMPIHPIGEQGRKGTLGSPYAVRDYRAVNAEFGTADDFKTVVRALHDAGMHVIIDLVANHTAWDNLLVTQHPEWYARDAKGKMRPPVPDWMDVVQLDYRQAGLREYMWSAMESWVRDFDIDGFRCDVAGMVPTSFWNEARRRLDRIKPVFMLAEAEKPELLAEAFDSDYASESYHAFNDIAAGKADGRALDRLRAKDAAAYPRGSWRMQFVTNHDQNSWNGTALQRLGVAGTKAFTVLSFTLPGKPLIYNGLEMGDAKKLAFFERDPIQWHASEFRPLLTRLSQLYASTPALYRGSMERIPATARSVYAFLRRDASGDPVLVAVNLSGSATRCRLSVKARSLGDMLGDLAIQVERSRAELTLEPWGYRVFRVGL